HESRVPAPSAPFPDAARSDSLPLFPATCYGIPVGSWGLRCRLLTAVPGHRAPTRAGSHEPYFISPSPPPLYASGVPSLRSGSLGVETTIAIAFSTAFPPPSPSSEAPLPVVGQYVPGLFRRHRHI